MTQTTGTCAVCGARCPYAGSRIDRHDNDGARCPGSFKAAAEARPSRPMTAAERRLSRRMFG